MKGMRVDQRNLTGAAAAEAERARESQSLGRDGRPGAASGGAGSDHVELSALSRALNAGASSRSARVQELTAQYQAGQYQPDAAGISRTMVGDALASSAAALP
jgi:anti-sigma28 factor (negative regulator of flagellin synthesis)